MKQRQQIGHPVQPRHRGPELAERRIVHARIVDRRVLALAASRLVRSALRASWDSAHRASWESRFQRSWGSRRSALGG
jgi:hypothetical protein